MFSCLVPESEEEKQNRIKERRRALRKQRKDKTREQWTAELAQLYELETLTKTKERRRRRLERKLGKRPKRRRPIRQYKRIPRTYRAYIKSKHWTARKNRYYQAHGKTCQACGSTTFVQLHHIVYGRYGEEKDRDLVALCRGCHEEFHTRYELKGNMRAETNQFIISKQEELLAEGMPF